VQSSRKVPTLATIVKLKLLATAEGQQSCLFGDTDGWLNSQINVSPQSQVHGKLE
jgi:hypothetical protein